MVLQVQLGHEVMKRFHLQKKVSPEGFFEKLDTVFDEYFQWFKNPGKTSIKLKFR